MHSINMDTEHGSFRAIQNDVNTTQADISAFVESIDKSSVKAVMSSFSVMPGSYLVYDKGVFSVKDEDYVMRRRSDALSYYASLRN